MGNTTNLNYQLKYISAIQHETKANERYLWKSSGGKENMGRENVIS